MTIKENIYKGGNKILIGLNIYIQWAILILSVNGESSLINKLIWKKYSENWKKKNL